MAAALLVDVWAANSTATSSTTLTLTVPAGGASAGTTLLFGVGSRANTLSSVVDSRDAVNNVYTIDVTKGYNSSVYDSIVRCTLVTSLQGGDTITLTFSAATLQKAATVSQWSGISAVSVIDQSVTPAGAYGSALDSGNMAATTNAADLVFGTFVAAAGSAVTYTAGTNLTALTPKSTDTNGAAGNSRTVAPFYRIVAATGTYKVNATASTNVQWSGAAVAYKAGTPTVTYNDSGSGTLTLTGTATSVLKLGTYTDSGTGTFAVMQGGFASSVVGAGPQYFDARSGTLTLTGTASSTFAGPTVYTNSASGTITLTGTSSSVFVAHTDYTDSATGTITLTGSFSSNFGRVLTLTPHETITITLTPY